MLHVDIDAFFASVEQLRNPRLAGRPVAVGSGVIASCSYEARRHGLHAGMALGRARRRCPQLAVVRGHEAIYRCYAARLFETCRRWSPQIEEHLDEAYCDLSGTERLHGDPIAVAQELRRSVHEQTGLTVTVGLGRNRMFARLVSGRRKPDGCGWLRPEEEEPLLRTLPVEQLPGVGGRTQAILQRLGIATVDDLRSLSRPALAALLGRNGELLYERCRGEDHRAIGNLEIPRSLQRSTTFHQDEENPATIDAMLEYLSERAARYLRGRGLETGGLTVRIVYSDHVSDRRRRALRPATALDGPLVDAAIALRRSLQKRRVALRHIGVTLDRLQRVSTVEADLFEAASSGVDRRSSPTDERWRRLLREVDRVRERHGHSAIIKGRALRLLEAGGADGGLERDRNGFILRTSCLTR